MGSRLFLIDGTGLVYRAFYAMKSDLKTSTGIPTNATYGVARMLTRFIKDWLREGDCVVFTMDKKTTTYRHRLLETYKANRPKTPDRMVEQLPYIKRLVEAMGIRIMEVEGHEADDLIATLTKKGKDVFDEIYIITGDKDMLQLVGDKIKVLRVGHRGLTELEPLDEDGVLKKFGVPPNRIVDFLALIGDKTDNVPGVKGIGEKTAVELIKKYGDLDNIYKNLGEIPHRISKLLVENRESAYLSRKLVELEFFEDEVDVNWEELRYKGVDEEKLKSIFRELEFTSLMKEFGFYEEYGEKARYECITSEEAFEDLLKKIERSLNLSLDLETTSLSPVDADIVGISISFKPFEAYYIPIGHKTGEKQLATEYVLRKLMDSLENVGIIGQNLKFDYSVLLSKGYRLKNISFDTMIAAYLLNPDQKKYGMDELALKYLNYKPISYKELMGDSLFGGGIEWIPIEKATTYAAEDADITYRLYEILNKRIYESHLDEVLNRIEIPLIPVLAEMELNGVYFDTEYLCELSKNYEMKMTEILSDMFRIVGERFNPNSPKQVARILFDKLKLKPVRKTKGGSFSTDAMTLEELSDQHEVVRLILEYRKYSKLKSTYLDILPRMVNPKTGRIHTSFNQTGTATGRLSSSEPNLQNIPKRDEEGREIRKAVIPQRKGWKIISADYSQIELRILAHFSKDENLIDAFKKGVDIHSLTASKIFNVPVEDVDESMRRVGKTVNFSIIYGITPFGLHQRLKLPVKECEMIITNYYKNYPGVREYIEKTLEKARKTGCVFTMFGRRREVPQLSSPNKNVQQEGFRIAVNTPIQGTAADVIKLAMVRIHNEMKRENLKSMMILQVHDELVFEVPGEEVEMMKEVITDGMENVVELDVPLSVSLKIDDHWE